MFAAVFVLRLRGSKRGAGAVAARKSLKQGVCAAWDPPAAEGPCARQGRLGVLFLESVRMARRLRTVSSTVLVCVDNMLACIESNMSAQPQVKSFLDEGINVPANNVRPVVI